MITLPFGVASEELGIAVFRLLPAGIDALDLRDGRRIWTSAETALPVALTDKYVLARLLAVDDDVIEFVTLDLGDGHTVARTEPLALPHPVRASAAGFTVRAEAAAGRFAGQWFAPARYAGGAPPPPDVLASRSDESGAFDIDPENGSVTKRGAPSATTLTAPSHSIRFDMTADYIVVARDTSGSVLWQHALGQSSSDRAPLRP
jgi:hypothetical protein